VKTLLKKLLTSRKFAGFISGIVGTIAARLGLEGVIGAEQAMQISQLIAGIAVAYILGQGAADFGKEKTEAEG